MERRRVFALITVLLAMLALAGPPTAEARKHRRHRAASRAKRCHGDKQCHGGTCNDAGQCCSTFGGEVACGATCCDTTIQGEACCGTACANLQTDNGNCGGCSVVCSGGKSCQNGACTCPLGETDCNGECISTLSDNANCGSCGHACTGAFKNCLDGACICPAGTTDCGDCVDTNNDPNNCGGCGILCGNGADCANGVCQSPCPICEVNENGTCVPRACGACEVCDTATNQCAPRCFPGQTCCGGDTCIDTQSDPNNCGGCGTACPSGVTCTNGTCDLCGEGFNTCSTGGCCRQDIAPTCCFGSRGGGGCCAPDTNCCLAAFGDGVCCPMGTHCCPNVISTPCWPADQPCQ